MEEFIIKTTTVHTGKYPLPFELRIRANDARQVRMFGPSILTNSLMIYYGIEKIEDLPKDTESGMILVPEFEKIKAPEGYEKDCIITCNLIIKENPDYIKKPKEKDIFDKIGDAIRTVFNWFKKGKKDEDKEGS